CFSDRPADLLDAVHLLEHADELVNLVRRVEALGDALPLAAPLCPRRDPRRHLGDAELAVLLVAVEPRGEGRERGVHEPEDVAAEEGLVPERPVQILEDFQHLGPRLRVRLALELPEPGAAVVDLLVDVVGPEASLRALVGVGGEEGGGVREGVVEVVEDDEGLVHGAAVVEEHRDLLVDRVGAEEAVALAGHEVLFDVLVGEAFFCQGDEAALPERAHPEVQQHQTLLARHCC
uniref:Uncharacterized protein n=1 Tax=Triticum urartu TaxID=4572 RepID=A0A8R7UJV6_TRIUA